MSWDYIQPVNIKFGEGMLGRMKEIAEEMGLKKGILVSDPFFAQNGLADRLMKENEGLLVCMYSQISPNPEVTEVDACAALMKEKEVEFTVALGGGSALDCAKAASTICFTEDSIRKYHGTGVELPKKHLPIIAIPTTAGTGSEVTCVSVLSDHELGKKGPINNNNFYPAVALIDPELTYTLPPYMTASCGIDVLCHAVEGFWSKGHQPICDALALHASELVFENIRTVYNDPQNKEARARMAEASVIAGLAFTLPKTTSSHACSFPLTNILHIPHGEACGLTLDYFARINAADPVEGPRINRFAQKLGFKDMNDMADAIAQLKKDLKLRTDLKEFNLTDEQVAELVRGSKHPNMLNNPVEITEEMLDKMYQSMR
ncbi:MAG TPA: iron-containing alcohol dehydrogenase [Candidatus Scatomonas pullistercoris]|uniref:Iron-containing alcohol dehydrogenase n=1 Tax=Candidatus Scatomonas pullistercoris TaxID=2840920 RepID=A0A9D1TB46_9FIRM|nr:iron-containing alcohol dehydrogenase [Candidatus Scatomonas pullistercoris]